MTAVPPGIRTYSALLWVVGAIVIGAIATTTVVSALSGPPRWLTDFPWERENPTIATQNGSTLSAPGNAMIVLPDALTTGSRVSSSSSGKAPPPRRHATSSRRVSASWML